MGADGGGVTALYGTVLDSDSDPATDTDACVAAFLTNHADALGVDGVVLEQTGKINIRNNKFTVYTYVQKIEGLPVHGTIVKIPVLLGATEKIPYVGGRVIDRPLGPCTRDRVDATGETGMHA